MYNTSPSKNSILSSDIESTRFSTDSVGQLIYYGGILFCCILLVGCGPTLNVSRDVELNGIEIKSIIIDAVKSEQTVNVEASAEQPFDLHLHLVKNQDALDAELARGAEPTKALAGSSNSKSHKISASVPGGKEAAVRSQSANGQSFTVKLSITN